MADTAKTTPGQISVEQFLAGLDANKRADSERLIAIMRDISGHEPLMWGSSIVGFDTYHYRYDSGREGDICAIGFSPRKANLTIYINEGFDTHSDLLEELGKYTTSVSCLYIKRLTDIDEKVLSAIIERSYKKHVSGLQQVKTVEQYVDTVPVAARKQLDHLRAIITRTLPVSTEVVSYGIIGYKVDKKRTVVYASGWKDHVALYPIPKNSELGAALKPYVRGKGTLWFDLEVPLPEDLIQEVVKAHMAERSA